MRANWFMQVDIADAEATLAERISSSRPLCSEMSFKAAFENRVDRTTRTLFPCRPDFLPRP